MNIEKVIRAWKAEQREEPDQPFLENPVGNELSDEELEEVVGGKRGGWQADVALPSVHDWCWSEFCH